MTFCGESLVKPQNTQVLLNYDRQPNVSNFGKAYELMPALSNIMVLIVSLSKSGKPSMNSPINQSSNQRACHRINQSIPDQGGHSGYRSHIPNSLQHCGIDVAIPSPFFASTAKKTYCGVILLPVAFATCGPLWFKSVESLQCFQLRPLLWGLDKQHSAGIHWLHELETVIAYRYGPNLLGQVGPVVCSLVMSTAEAYRDLPLIVPSTCDRGFPLVCRSTK